MTFQGYDVRSADIRIDWEERKSVDKRTRGYHVGSIIKPRMLPTNKTLHLSRASHITQNCMSLQVLC